MTRRRSGLTLIELLIVVSIIGILARIAIPKFNSVRRRTQATAIVSELVTVRDAAFHYNADTQLWPPNTAAGTMPAVLIPYLPKGLKFQPSATTSYVWLLNGMSGNNPINGTDNSLMAIGVNTPDAALRTTVLAAMGGNATYVSGSAVYFLLWGRKLRP